MEKLEQADRKYWEEPDGYGLVRERNEDEDYFVIYTLGPQLMMMISENSDYIRALSQKMLTSGVKVFDTVKELYEFNLEKHAKK